MLEKYCLFLFQASNSKPHSTLLSKNTKWRDPNSKLLVCNVWMLWIPKFLVWFLIIKKYVW